MSLLRLALASLRNRRASALLTLLTIAASVTLLLAVERVREQARSSFASTVSGTDLIVGARGGALQLLLYSVFRIGDAPQNFSWDSFVALRQHSSVAWAIPISLGDSHRGFRVLGTDGGYFQHYRYGGGQLLEFATGRAFEEPLEAVLGSEVARQLGHSVGSELVLAHGLGQVSFANHDDDPFRVVGVLAATGTPVDRTVHVSLDGLSWIHRDWQSGVHIPGSGGSAQPSDAAGSDAELAGEGHEEAGHEHEHGHEHDHVGESDDQQHDEHVHAGAHEQHEHAPPGSITAALIGLKVRVQAMALQRQINEFAAEPLTAILPALTLQQLWSLVSVAEDALRVVTILMVLAGLLGMTATLVTSLGERRREMAVLRAVGAAPRHVFGLLLAEAVVLALAGIALALALFYLALAIIGPLAQAQFGLALPITAPSGREWALLGLVLLAAVVAGLVPAIAAFRRSLSDGLSLRL